jgi:K+-sensing histidine kinase KdpD
MSGGEKHSEVTPLIAAAHELKAPLALMRQTALLLQSHHADEHLSSSEAQKLLQRISLTAERALRLTSDLTRVSRLEDALFSLEPVNPEEVCKDIIAELTPLFEAHGKQVAMKGRTHPLLLVANRDLLRRILLGFNDNALHYSQPGTAVHMQITAFKKAGIVRIGVRDYGPALSADMWRTLRSKLAHAPQSVHARPESSGLGLYIAGQFAEAMQGTIGAIRHKDGATFYVDLQASTQLSLL